MHEVRLYLRWLSLSMQLQNQVVGKKINLKYLICVYQVMTQADLGLADAYINGDFSFVDKDKGLLNLFLVSIII